MKKFNQNYVWVLACLMLIIGYLHSCTKDDQVLDTGTPDEPEIINSETDLVSLRVSTPPVLDGNIDAVWGNSQRLSFSTQVPEVTGDVFRGYTGNIIPSVSLRSVYDDNNIYFLAEWSDPTQSLLREPWYFDPATKTWNQEEGKPTFSATGSITRAAFYEDKAAMLWNISNSVLGWNNGTCYKSCHTDLPATDGSSRHFTNYSTERIDMWHWKAVRGGVNGGYQFDDQYQDNTYPNGRKSDTGGGAYTDNVQTLTVTSTSTQVTVPKYFIPGRTNYGWIMKSEVDSGIAVLITAVDSNGVLSYASGTIDPNTDAAFQRSGATVGAKAIPGIIISSYTGNRGDISCKASYTGSGWILEFKRALKTSDTENKDIDFSSLANQYFGFAIFENAQIAHSIKPNLVLKFQQ